MWMLWDTSPTGNVRGMEDQHESQSGLPAHIKSSCRADADALEGMLCLAAATQHAETARPEPKGFEPVRQESVSSDNDYSEEQYVTMQRQGFPRGGPLESEEDKKEKRCCAFLPPPLENREALTPLLCAVLAC